MILHPYYSLLTFLLLITCTSTLASPGDHSPVYQQCLKTCPDTTCPPSTHHQINAHEPWQKKTVNSTSHHVWINPDPILEFMRWDCPAECKYTCMHLLSTSRSLTNQTVTKFYGKWPFVRVLGSQEIISSISSLLNGVPHFLHFFLPSYHRLYAPVKRGYYMSWPLRLMSLICVNSWIWSGVFHSRDTKFTEKCDYYFATSQTLYGVWIASYRVAGNGPIASAYAPRGIVVYRIATACSCIAFYCYYINHMENILFDYGLHMKINTALVVLHLSIWLSFIIKNHKRRPYVKHLLTFLVGILLASSCEILDFPPVYGVMDAHATWHCATVPFVFVWYWFWVADAEFNLRERERGEEKKMDGVN